MRMSCGAVEGVVFISLGIKRVIVTLPYLSTQQRVCARSAARPAARTQHYSAIARTLQGRPSNADDGGTVLPAAGTVPARSSRDVVLQLLLDLHHLLLGLHTLAPPSLLGS